MAKIGARFKEKGVLKLEYLLMSLSAFLLGGYAAYFVIRMVLAAQRLGTLFKVVILVGMRMLILATTEAIECMVLQAEKLGANAVVGVCFTAPQTMSGAAEILAYGTLE
jgi:hypothetical protein